MPKVDKCGQGEGGGKKWYFCADVLYGWPQNVFENCFGFHHKVFFYIGYVINQSNGYSK